VSFDPARDQDGMVLALNEIFEQDFARVQIERETAGANPETKRRLLQQIPKRTLSPGYYTWANHLLWLEDRRKAGIAFSPAELSMQEAAGLVALDRARADFNFAHPPCSACGARQRNRYGQECSACGAKFRRKGAK
jgi:hypothetical protein